MRGKKKSLALGSGNLTFDAYLMYAKLQVIGFISGVSPSPPPTSSQWPSQSQQSRKHIFATTLSGIFRLETIRPGAPHRSSPVHLIHSFLHFLPCHLRPNIIQSKQLCACHQGKKVLFPLRTAFQFSRLVGHMPIYPLPPHVNFCWLFCIKPSTHSFIINY